MSDVPIHLFAWKSEFRMRYHLHSPVRSSTDLNIEILNCIVKNKVAYCSIIKTGNSELSHCCWRTQTKWCSGISVLLSEFLTEGVAPAGESEDVADLREEPYATARTVELEKRRRLSGDLVKPH